MLNIHDQQSVPVGGVAGFLRTGSKPSLIAGLGLGASYAYAGKREYDIVLMLVLVLVLVL